MKKIFFITLLVFAFVSSNALAQVAAKPASGADAVVPEIKELVRRLLEANGMRASLIRIFEDIIKNAPAESQKALQDVLKSDAIIDNIIPVYAKHFTADELKELIAFYKSPTGAKNLALTPQLMVEVMEVSQKYFEDNAKEIPKPAQTK